jgi:hypothetical protein
MPQTRAQGERLARDSKVVNRIIYEKATLAATAHGEKSAASGARNETWKATNLATDRLKVVARGSTNLEHLQARAEERKRS